MAPYAAKAQQTAAVVVAVSITAFAAVIPVHATTGFTVCQSRGFAHMATFAW